MRWNSHKQQQRTSSLLPPSQLGKRRGPRGDNPEGRGTKRFNRL
jgi:hypothetical protein